MLHRFLHGPHDRLNWEAATRLKCHLGLLSRNGGSRRGEQALINSIDSVLEARWFLRQNLAALMKENPKVATTILARQERYLGSALEDLEAELEALYPEHAARRNGKATSRSH
jgi:hypothetical protein